MAGPWEKYAAPAAPSSETPAPPADGPWSKYAPAKPESERWKGGILPISEGPDGRPQFDTDAGIIGGLKRAFTTPGDVMSGKIDLNTDEGFGRALELSGFASPVPPAIRAGKLGTIPPKAPAPTAGALKEAADAGYNAVREMGVDYATPAVTDMINGVKAGLEQKGILAELAPKTHAIIGKFANPPEGSVVTVAGLEAARRAAGHAAKDFSNPTEQLAASRLIQGIDDFIGKGDPRTVVAGPAAEAGQTLTTARANSAAAKRSESLTGIEEKADLRAAASGSGTNFDNTLRQRVVDIVADPKRSRGFTPEEIQLLEKLVGGDFVRNTLRRVGNMTGGGGGLGAAVAGGLGAAAGAAAAGPGGAAAGAAAGPIVGALARSVQNALARRELAAVDTVTRQRSPLYQEMLGAAQPGARDMGYHTGIMGLGVPAILQDRQPQTMQQLGADPAALMRFLREGGA
jgi:hypothetical protein